MRPTQQVRNPTEVNTYRGVTCTVAEHQEITKNIKNRKKRAHRAEKARHEKNVAEIRRAMDQNGGIHPQSTIIDGDELAKRAVSVPWYLNERGEMVRALPNDKPQGISTEPILHTTEWSVKDEPLEATGQSLPAIPRAVDNSLSPWTREDHIERVLRWNEACKIDEGEEEVDDTGYRGGVMGAVQEDPEANVRLLDELEREETETQTGMEEVMPAETAVMVAEGVGKALMPKAGVSEWKKRTGI